MVEWISWNDQEHGRMFINKFKTNSKNRGFWIPSGHSASSYTDLVTFGDLYKMDGLESALIMDNKPGILTTRPYGKVATFWPWVGNRGRGGLRKPSEEDGGSSGFGSGDRSQPYGGLAATSDQ